MFKQRNPLSDQRTGKTHIADLEDAASLFLYPKILRPFPE